MSVSTARGASSLAEILADRVGRANALLALIAGAYLMIALDSTVVNVALPSIQADLHFSPTGLAWVFNAYLLTFGGLLLLGGRLGDLFGRRRVFIVGVTLFTAASLLAGLAASDTWLVVARAIQGVGGALATPNTMALLATNFAEGPVRNRALSIYSAVAMGGASIGLLVGGILTTYASWRWAMFVNVPIGLTVVAIAPQLVEDTERRPGRIDAAGALTSTVAMGLIVFGFIRAGSAGWDGGSFASLGAGVILLGVFLAIEMRAQQPVVPVHLLRTRRRLGAYLNLLLMPGAVFGTFFFVTQYLQDVRGFGPLAAGVAFLPQTFAMVAAVRAAPVLVQRLGATRVLIMGGLLVFSGLVLLSRLTPESSYFPSIVVGLVLVGAGAGWSFMPLNVTILAGVDAPEAGAASAVAQSMQWVGGSLGLAVLVTVFGASSHAATASLGSAAAHTATGVAMILTRGATSALDAGTLFAVASLVVTAGVIARAR